MAPKPPYRVLAATIAAERQSLLSTSTSLLEANSRNWPEGLKEIARYSAIDVIGTAVISEPLGSISELDLNCATDAPTVQSPAVRCFWVPCSSPKPNDVNLSTPELANTRSAELIRSDPVSAVRVRIVSCSPLAGSQIEKRTSVPGQGQQMKITREADSNKPTHMQPPRVLPRTYRCSLLAHSGWPI